MEREISLSRRSRDIDRGISSCAFKEAAGTGDGDGLVHHPLAHDQVLVDPLGHFLVVTRNSVGLETGPRASPTGSRVRRGLSLDMVHQPLNFRTHVKPVDRFMPARMVETARYMSELWDRSAAR